MFDFDHTLVDENTDTFIVEQLWPEVRVDLKNWRHSGHTWTEVMRLVLDKLLTRFKVADLTEAMEKCPISEKTVEFLRKLHENGHEVNIISDSNLYFIETILKKHNILHCVANIHTNDAIVNEDLNTIRLTEYSVACKKPHSCTVSVSKGV